MKDDAHTIRIDSDLEDLIPGYLKRRREDIASIREAVERNDLEALRVLGHTMKGSGGGYGFDRITEIGRCIEGAAQDGDGEECLRYAGELGDYLDNLTITFT